MIIYQKKNNQDITCLKLLEVLRDDVGKEKNSLECDRGKDGHKPMGTFGMQILHKLQPWAMLSELIIPNNQIKDEGLKYLVAIDWKLKKLNLAQNNLTKGGVVGNICNDNLKKKWDLEYLNLSGNGIDSGDSTRIVKEAYNDYERRRHRCGWKNVMVTRYRDKTEFMSGELRQKLMSFFPKLSNKYGLVF